jgi:raffinose/stachyose/melibiose transport system permease protein
MSASATTRTSTPSAPGWHEATMRRFSSLPFLLPALVIYAVFALYPMVDGLWLSFFDWDGVSADRNWVGLENYVQIFTQDPVFWRAVENSLIWVTLSLIIPTAIGLAFAVALDQKLRGRNAFRAALYLPAVIASIAVATMWSWMYNPIFGLVNAAMEALGLEWLIQDWLGDPDIALFSILVAYSWQATGAAMVLFLAGLQNVPAELREAARVDGANRRQVFRAVTFPALMPTFVVVTVLSIISSLKVFDLVYGMTLGGPAQSTQVLALWSYTQSFGLHDYGNGMAVAMVLLAVTLVIVIPYYIWMGRRDDA